MNNSMKRFYFTILCVVLSLSACVTPDAGIEDQPTNGRTTLTAVTSQLKITTPEAVLEGATGHTWSTEMHIGAFGKEGGENAKYSLFNSYEGAAEGLFYGAEVKGDIYAYYPYNKEVAIDGSKVALIIPDTQKYDADLIEQFNQHNNIYVAKSVDGNLEFGYIYGYLGIQINGNFTVKSVKLTSKDAPLAGRVAFDFDNEMRASAVARSLYAYTIDCGEGIVATEEAPAKVYALLPPATYANLSVEIVTDKGVLAKALNGTYEVVRLHSALSEEQMSSGTIVADFETLSLGDLAEVEPRKWGEGATVGVFSENSKNTRFAIEASSVGGTEAQFVGAEAKGAVVAYYPYAAQTTYTDGKLQLSADNKQIYNENLLTQFAESAPFMVAKAEEGEKLSFEYVMGVLGLNIRANVNIKYVEVSSSKPLAGKLLIDTANGYLCSAPESGSKNTITLDASALLPTASLDAPRKMYVSLPAGEYDDLQVTVTSENGDILAKSVSEKVTIQRMNLATIAEDITYQTIDITLEEVEYAKSAWVEGDKVALYSEARGKGIVSDLLSPMGSAKNSIIVVGTTDEPYNLAYPASAVKSLGSSAVVEFPAVQKYNGEQVAAASQIYVGRNNGGKGEMKLLSSILGVTVMANYDCKVNGITLTSKNYNLAGTAEVDMAYEEEPEVMFTEGVKSVKLVMEEPQIVANGASKTFYFAVPVGTYEAEDLSVVVDGSLGATMLNIAVQLPAVRAGYNETALSTIKCTNLTEGGKYANCFVMPNKKGWYMFDAKIRGGYDKDEDGNAVITEKSIAGTLFELNKGMITDVAVCNNSQSVSFYYDGSMGNASIVTIEGGMVLWAWHLWCPGEDQPKSVVYGENTYMDRNLGSLHKPNSKAEMEAMSDEEMLASGGMLYQWGRPSPFPYVTSYTPDPEAWASRLGQASNKNTSNYNYPSANHITAGSYGSAASSSSKPTTAFASQIDVLWSSNAAATKSPLLIGCMKNDGSNRKWNSEWNFDVSHEKASWNYSIEEHKQYDPCPYGYELPTSDQLAADVTAFFSVNTSVPYLINGEANVFKGGYYLEHEGSFHWWPITGLRYNYGLWGTLKSPNSNVSGASTSSSNKLFVYVNTKLGSARTVNTGNFAPCTAMAVRCVKK